MHENILKIENTVQLHAESMAWVSFLDMFAPLYIVVKCPHPWSNLTAARELWHAPSHLPPA